MLKVITLKVKHLIKEILSKTNWLPEIIIFAFAFFTRLLRLNVPSTYMFDEVYHAFTAEQMFKGNPAAWEWWNTPPKGFAYEWTHPPLAKEFMVIAMSIFGDNAFESLTPNLMNSFSICESIKTPAKAIGPITGPLPASSIPSINIE